MIHNIQLILSLLLVIAVWLPVLVRNDYWVFRILEYPRFQKLLLCLAVLISWLFTIEEGETIQFAAVAILFVSCGYLLYKIWPYTPLSRIEIFTVSDTRKGNQMKLFAANVYEKNHNYGKLLEQIRGCDPDIVFLVETDEDWRDALRSLDESYPHSLKKPLDNTYGLLFYSKFELGEDHVRFLVQREVPSVEALVKLPSGTMVRLWGLHPKPPVPGEDERTTAKDKELLRVAEMAARSAHPVIVLGDLNDVAWSYTTKLFRKTSHLLDPRRGRGFYSTFNAKSLFMRFPLDYVFCSNDFGLIKMKRLPKFGSDHFPMFIHLQHDPDLKKIQVVPKADASEQEEAEDKKSKRPHNS